MADETKKKKDGKPAKNPDALEAKAKELMAKAKKMREQNQQKATASLLKWLMKNQEEVLRSLPEKQRNDLQGILSEMK